MNEIQKKIDQAYNILSTIFVRGDGADAMAAARQLLKEAFNAAETKTQEAVTDGK